LLFKWQVRCSCYVPTVPATAVNTARYFTPLSLHFIYIFLLFIFLPSFLHLDYLLVPAYLNYSARVSPSVRPSDVRADSFPLMSASISVDKHESIYLYISKRTIFPLHDVSSHLYIYLRIYFILLSSIAIQCIRKGSDKSKLPFNPGRENTILSLYYTM
jgi:hypothetical protein